MSGDARAPSRSVLHHVLPLDPDSQRRAEFLLPPDLTTEEAERLARFVHTLINGGA